MTIETSHLPVRWRLQEQAGAKRPLEAETSMICQVKQLGVEMEET